MANVGIAIINLPFLMVGIPPIEMVMNGGWFMKLLYQPYMFSNLERLNFNYLSLG